LAAGLCALSGQLTVFKGWAPRKGKGEEEEERREGGRDDEHPHF